MVWNFRRLYCDRLVNNNYLPNHLKKQRLQIGDVILIQEGNPSYILTKYSDEEVKKLTKMGERVSFKPKRDDESNILLNAW